ncbi:MAG: FIG00652507: hypothetical protein [uncultured Sulfurovum sp.]|uniref:Alpha-2-macroglobulin domain-containing protein n=1 Tax=uncultured Sulfurovum sp. TaxID=269237 RepID=A0A6S6T6I4_9BACT|nr:MAG: FIG00652507: hypothetical protein [uncultured Sulfurovum sp.]
MFLFPLFLFSFNYTAQWKQVETFDQQQLPKSALEKVNLIYDKAKEEQNTVQFIRATIYKKNYATILEEKSDVSAINVLKKAISESTKSEEKLILTSLLAEFYTNYLEKQYYQIKNRTTVKDNASTDISTWSIEELTNKATQLYLSTLKPEGQNIFMEKYQSILTKGEHVEGLYPTLYDFLAFRALKYFKNTRHTLQTFNQDFQLTSKEAFTSAQTFRNYPFIVNNSLKYNALLVYQKLLHFHKNNKYPKAHMHINLERLFFVRQNITHNTENASQKYEEALKSIAEQHLDSEVLTNLAQFYVEKKEYVKAMHYVEQGLTSRDTYIQKRLNAIKNDIQARKIQLQVEEVNLPHENILASLQYRNIETLFVRVLKPTKEEFKKFNSLYKTAEKQTYLKSLNSFKTFHVDLVKDHDYKQHATELSLGNYDLGSYLFLFSEEANFTSNVSHQSVNISNIAYLQQKNKLLVLHRKTGEPLENVKATFYKNQRNQESFLEEAHSDKNGFVNLPKVYGEYKIVFEYNSDRLNSKSYSQNDYERDKSSHQQVIFFTDRSIYRPNQPIYFKGLAVEHSSIKKPKILTNTSVTVSFLNTNNQKIESKEFTTDEYGTFHGEFTSPSSGLLGYMQLNASIGGSTGIRVEEYKRPKFEVTFKKLQNSYVLGDNIQLLGEAKAYAGNGISNAKVSYDIKRIARFPWRNYWEPYPPHNEKVIKEGDVQTDEQGLFHIDFDALKVDSLDSHSPNYYYTVTASVTDTTGETQRTYKTIVLGMVGIRADMLVNTAYSTEENKTITVETKNLDGEFQALQGEIVIEKLAKEERLYKRRYWDDEQNIDRPLYTKEAFEKLFPNYKFLEEESKAEKHFIKSIPFDTQQSKKVSLGTLEQGEYLLTLHTTDSSGKKVSTSETVNIYDLKAKDPHQKTTLWYKNFHNEYKAGENIVLDMKSSIKNLPILLSIERPNQAIEEKWIHINELTQAIVKLKDADRGGIAYQMTYVHENRFYHHMGTVAVPWDTELNVEYLSFRDKLKPNEEEQWKIKISGQNKEKVMANMVATMYDASLDALNPHHFNPVRLYPGLYSDYRLQWQGKTFSPLWLHKNWKLQKLEHTRRTFQEIKWINDYNSNQRMNRGGGFGGAMPAMAPMAMEMAVEDMSAPTGNAMMPKNMQIPPDSVPQPKIRKNLKETMFFLPNLQTDEEGNILIDFKTNEALTRWNFMAFVHTKDLKTAVTQKTLTTSKELMVVTNLPRFFREKDQITLSAKVVNMSQKDLNGTCELQLVDPSTQKPIFEREFIKNVSIKKGASSVVEFKFTVPNVDEVSAIQHTIIAKTASHSDAEQIIKSILSNRVFVTESKNMFVSANEEKSFTLASLKNTTSPTLSNHKLTLEFTSNPAWYAIKSLPYLMEYPHECNEQLFNRYFANALAAKIANSSPKIKEVFESWKSKKELISALETNQELKSVLLEETPWVFNAKSQEEQQANLGILFDLVRLAKEEKSTYNKLIKRQFEHKDGGWAWFESPHSNWYITQYIVEGFGKLKKLGIDKTNTEAMGVATHYIDMQMLEQYKKLLKNVEDNNANLENDHLSSILTHYLYARSFYNFKMSSEIQEAHDYYLEQAKRYWVNKGLYEQGMIALTLESKNDHSTAMNIVKSLKERALVNNELGMYFKYTHGYYWNQMPLETHALMIDVFNTVAKDKASVTLLKTWLLKNKQTTHWKTTKATASAIYALLSDGKWVENNEAVQVDFDTTLPYKEKIKMASKQAGTGYFKVAFDNFDQSMATVKVKNPNDNIAWGALYWQYFEEMDKVKTFKETPLTIDKKLFLIETSAEHGEQLSSIENHSLKVGDKVKVRIEIRVDRDMEFVMLKDSRASAFEPINVLSRYKYQDGLGYYESTKDNATYFFIDYLAKGTYVFEYPLVLTHKGDFSNGITTMESMYAPEFKSHSEGIRIHVK